MKPIPTRLGRLTFTGDRDAKTKRYIFKCDCGNLVRKSMAAIRATQNRSERCMCSSCAGRVAA